jgi:hypothetical protein
MGILGRCEGGAVVCGCGWANFAKVSKVGTKKVEASEKGGGEKIHVICT